MTDKREASETEDEGRTKRVLFMGAVKSRADKTTRVDGRTDGRTDGHGVTLARLTDQLKLANEARKRAKSHNVERSVEVTVFMVFGDCLLMI